MGLRHSRQWHLRQEGLRAQWKKTLNLRRTPRSVGSENAGSMINGFTLKQLRSTNQVPALE
jgi:hypothetical protein